MQAETKVVVGPAKDTTVQLPQLEPRGFAGLLPKIADTSATTLAISGIPCCDVYNSRPLTFALTYASLATRFRIVRNTRQWPPRQRNRSMRVICGVAMGMHQRRRVAEDLRTQ